MHSFPWFWSTSALAKGVFVRLPCCSAPHTSQKLDRFNLGRRNRNGLLAGCVHLLGVSDMQESGWYFGGRRRWLLTAVLIFAVLSTARPQVIPGESVPGLALEGFRLRTLVQCVCVCAGEAVRERGGVQTLLVAVSLPI